MAKLVAQVYSNALFEKAIEKEKIDFIYEEIKSLKDIFKEEVELVKMLNSPKISKEEKILSIKEIFEKRVSDEVMGFLLIIIEKNRQVELDKIFEDFIAKVKEYKNIGLVYVKSAIDLSDEIKKKIEDKILATSKYEKLEMNFVVDKEILGGLVIRINDRVIDSSVSKKLSNMKRELLNIQLS